MQSIKTICFIFILLFSSKVFAQNENGVKMKSFIPKSNAYDIYYPDNFSIIESNEGIVSIKDTVSQLEITVSAFMTDKNLKDQDLIKILNDFVKGYFQKEIRQQDWNSYKTKFDNLVELKLTDLDMNWVWWGVNNKKRIIVISANKKNIINSDEIKLIQFMIDNMIIKQ